MVEVLNIYVSGFWPWLGITIGLAIVASGASGVLTALLASVVTIRSAPEKKL